MAPEKSNTLQRRKAPEDEYIDIIDVLGFLWRAKVFVIIGIALVVAAALGVVNSKKPPVYITTMPINLEVAGGVTPEQITSKFNSLLARTDVQKDLQSAGVGFVGGKAPFKLVRIAEDMMLEFSSLSADPSGEKALIAVRVLTESSRKLDQLQSEASAKQPPVKQVKTDLESQFGQLAAAQLSEEAPFRVKLFALEARLAQKSGIRPAPATFVKGSSLGDDVFRLLGAADTKLTATEKEAVIREYSQLAGAIKAIEAKYQDPLTQLGSSLSASSGVLTQITKGYPVVVADEAAFKSSVAIGTHERYESKRRLFVALGVMLGGLLGLMAYGLVQFGRENASRLRKILQ